MMTQRFRPTLFYFCLVFTIVFLGACGSPPDQGTTAAKVEPPAAQAAAATPPNQETPCPDPTLGSGDYRNHPFQKTECWTTSYGPAEADVILGNPLKSTNMLYCDSGTYALCFFSGPPEPTGHPGQGNQRLPCEVRGEGDIANCTCEVYTASPSEPYFVDINAILNYGVYNQTVKLCGADGSRCANIANCGQDGSVAGCADQQPAPVCRYVNAQNPTDPTVSLYPKADMISTFSFAMNDTYTMKPESCPPGYYAGCMTAPCFLPAGAANPPNDGDPVQCECPTYNGDYQVGQPDQSCAIGSRDGKMYLWSAANTVTGSDAK